TPSNYPLLQPSSKIPPPLPTPSSLLIKPTQITPLTTIPLFQFIHQLPFPKPTINLLLDPAPEVHHLMSPHQQLHLLSFTAPIQTPKHIIKQPPNHLTHLPLQLPP
ncbi:aldehyde dehydrogenase family protein, partial [Staphylococcus epidermidis]|uniref:aldehyde dehydrogenase family protein n=1 Tax=Staphylococcus epidermidis TaxID=1282 RepID=UPI0011A16CD2